MAAGFRRAALGATSRLRGQLRAAASRPRGWLGWPGAEIVLALAVGVAAFVLAAVAGAAARSHLPAVLFGLLLLAAVLAVARFAVILFALPVGVVTILAFDWYFLPPLRKLDSGTVLVLGLFLAMSVIVGAVATQAGRRATGSEEARGVLADEQAALRRVATLVARQPSPAEVFAAVTEEAGRLLHLDSAHLLACEEDRTVTVAGAWNLRGAAGAGRHAGTTGRGQRCLPRVPHASAGPHRRLHRHRRAGRRLRALRGSLRGGRCPDCGRGTALGGHGRRLLAARAAARGNGVPYRRVHRARRHGDREQRDAHGAGTSRRGAGGARPRRDARRRGRPAGRRLHRGRRRGRRAVRGSACRAVPLRAGRRGNSDRRGGRGLVLSRPALALPGR